MALPHIQMARKYCTEIQKERHGRHHVCFKEGISRVGLGVNECGPVGEKVSQDSRWDFSGSLLLDSNAWPHLQSPSNKVNHDMASGIA